MPREEGHGEPEAEVEGELLKAKGRIIAWRRQAEGGLADALTGDSQPADLRKNAFLFTPLTLGSLMTPGLATEACQDPRSACSVSQKHTGLTRFPSTLGRCLGPTLLLPFPRFGQIFR